MSIVFKKNGTASETPVIIPGDTDQLIQLFRNLIENAIHYGYKNSDITVEITPLDTMVSVTIMDQGVGISKNDIPRLTERFYRVDQARSGSRDSNAHDAINSTGLGLAIVKHILRRHRGRLTVESVVDQGSTFKVLLPGAE